MRKYFSLLLPFSLTAGILLLDQITKALVLAYVPPGTIAWRFLGDWFWLVRQQNLGIAFSMGDSLPNAISRARRSLSFSAGSSAE
jgi:signal peptidase II